MKNKDFLLMTGMADRLAIGGRSISMREAAQLMGDAGESGVVVTEDDHQGVVGIFTEGDLRRETANGTDPSTPIGGLMTPQEKLVTAGEDESLADTARKMVSNPIRHVIIKDKDGSYKGCISSERILRFLFG